MGRSLAAVVVLAAMAVAGLTACRPVVEPRDPAIAGVVVSRQFITGDTVRYSLATGATFDVDVAAVKTLSGGTPDVGDLLFYGEHPERWLLGLNPSSEGGFGVWTQSAEFGDGHFIFDSGLRLPVAPGYREAGGGRLEPGAPVMYRLDELGQVVVGPVS